MDTTQYGNQYLRLSCIRLHIVKPFGIPLTYKRIEGRAIVIFSLDLVYQQKIVVYNRVLCKVVIRYNCMIFGNVILCG